MLDVIGHLLAFFLVHMPDIIVELLNILPLQIGITFFLLIIYDLFMKNKQQKPVKVNWKPCAAIVWCEELGVCLPGIMKS